MPPPITTTVVAAGRTTEVWTGEIEGAKFLILDTVFVIESALNRYVLGQLGVT
ncbi:hypothetical protein SAMN05216593_101579 [Pseudomonas asturiensis]|uniref:Uncharacterized protein n=1 Tax=Pseudomonas asturiensis TaxID=1190415 RepID=A0A1M7JVS5_9PSED|nr:hypothetical protein SAMN05444507_107339 [Pseudomonas syringae]SHM57094.1 hypothetical protein SAMN05216593_101579 [Pseudomonas asturiensis]